MSVTSHIHANALHIGLQVVEGNNTLSEFWKIESTAAGKIRHKLSCSASTILC